MPVYDVRDYTADAPSGIYTFGGFIGELMITLNTLQEYMNTKSDTKIEMDEQSILNFIQELLVDGYPQGICTIRMDEDPLDAMEKADNAGNAQELATVAANHILSSRKKVKQFGLNWLLSVVARLGISQDIVKDVLHAICKIHFYEP